MVKICRPLFNPVIAGRIWTDLLPHALSSSMSQAQTSYPKSILLPPRRDSPLVQRDAGCFGRVCLRRLHYTQWARCQWVEILCQGNHQTVGLNMFKDHIIIFRFPRGVSFCRGSDSYGETVKGSDIFSVRIAWTVFQAV